MKAQKQLPSDIGLVRDDGSRAQDRGLARGEAEAVECGRAEARDLLLEQQRVRIAWQQADGEASAVALADQRRARRARRAPTAAEQGADGPRAPRAAGGQPRA